MNKTNGWTENQTIKKSKNSAIKNFMAYIKEVN